MTQVSDTGAGLETAEVQPGGPESVAGAATRALFERVEALCREVEQQRFAGERPVITLDATLSLEEVAARVLAAERVNANLLIGGVPVNPLEDTAEEMGRRALVSLSYGNFGAAQALLEEAAGRTRLPELQQRLTLWRALVDFQRRCVMAEITSPLHGAPEQRVLELLDQLDHLPLPERKHYRAEVLRLAALRAGAAGDTYLQTVWCLVRARRALAEQEDILAMAWLYRAYRLNAGSLARETAGNEYLAGLLEQARREVLRAAGEMVPDGSATAGAGEDAPPRAHDLYAALAGALTTALGRDVRRDTVLFAVTEYQALPEEHGSQAARDKGTA